MVKNIKYRGTLLLTCDKLNIIYRIAGIFRGYKNVCGLHARCKKARKLNPLSNNYGISANIYTLEIYSLYGIGTGKEVPAKALPYIEGSLVADV